MSTILDDIKSRVIPHIRRTIETGKTWKDQSLHYPVEALGNVLEAEGFEVDLGLLETNGWQWDWWFPVKWEGRYFTLGGSGYYGGLKFYAEK